MSLLNAIPSCRHRFRLRHSTACLIPWLLIALAGCSYPETPTASAPSSLGENALSDHSFSESGTVPVESHWWTAFNDAQLNTWVDKALRENLSLAQAWARLSEAEATLTASSAARFPSLGLQTSVRRTFDDATTANPPTDRTTGSLDLIASYELDLWGKVRSEARGAYFEYRATEQDLRAASISIAGQIAITWYNLVERRAQQSLLKAQYQNAEQTLESIRMRFQHGSRNATDLLQQQQVIEARSGALIQNQAEIEILEHHLGILTGSTALHIEVQTPDTFPELPEFPSTGIPAAIITARPDIQAAWLRLQAADAAAATAVANRFPSLTLGAVLSSAFGGPVQLFDEWMEALTASLSASLIDGGLRRAEVDRRQALLSSALLNYRQTVLEALREVEDAIVQERQQQAFLESLSRQIVLAEQVFDQTFARYQSGDQSYLQVLTAQDSLHQLRRTALTAQLQLLQFRIALYRSLGSGFEPVLSDAWQSARSVTGFKFP